MKNILKNSPILHCFFLRAGLARTVTILPIYWPVFLVVSMDHFSQAGYKEFQAIRAERQHIALWVFSRPLINGA